MVSSAPAQPTLDHRRETQASAEARTKTRRTAARPRVEAMGTRSRDVSEYSESVRTCQGHLEEGGGVLRGRDRWKATLRAQSGGSKVMPLTLVSADSVHTNDGRDRCAQRWLLCCTGVFEPPDAGGGAVVLSRETAEERRVLQRRPQEDGAHRRLAERRKPRAPVRPRQQGCPPSAPPAGTHGPAGRARRFGLPQRHQTHPSQ